MYLTVEKLVAQGIQDFALIHDSFAVSCNNIGYLNVAVREAYVELFESHPLKQWYTQIQKITTEPLPHYEEVMINDLDLQEVKESLYLFN